MLLFALKNSIEIVEIYFAKYRKCGIFVRKNLI